MASQPALAHLRLDLLAAISTICPDIRGRAGRIENVVEPLAVVHRHVSDLIAANQLVPAVNAHMVLVPKLERPYFLVQRALVSFWQALWCSPRSDGRRRWQSCDCIRGVAAAGMVSVRDSELGGIAG